MRWKKSPQKGPLICVVCNEQNTNFSNQYEVHENNNIIFKKFFHKDIPLGALCNRCYSRWYNSTQRKKNKSKQELTELTCVICKSKSPEVKFSKGYKVHDKNISIIKICFGREDIEFGAMCSRCYHVLYKAKKLGILGNLNLNN